MPAAPALPGATPWIVAPIVALAAFMEVLDISIANVALQNIAGGLSAGQEESTWVLTSYLVANAIVLPMSGWLSGRFGRKRYFLACVAGFTASSLLCGMATSLAQLVAFRCLQGLCGGGLQPVSQAILSDAFPPRQQGLAMAFYGMSVVFAPAVGPMFGGWLTDQFGWHWIFLINVPVGLLLALLSIRQLAPDGTGTGRAGAVDYVSIGLLAIGLGCLQLLLDQGQTHDWWASDFICTLALAAGASLLAFLAWERRSADPIVDLGLLRDRNFALANLLMFVLGFMLLASTVLIPILAQRLLGYSASEAGRLLSPGGFVMMAMMPLVGGLVARIDARWFILLGLLGCSFALYNMGRLNAQADFAAIAWSRVYQAAGMALLFIPINTAGYAKVPADRNDHAAALINLSRNLGGSVGISLMVTLVDRGAQTHQTYLVAHLSPGSEALAQMAQRLGAHRIAAAAPEDLSLTLAYSAVLRQASLLAILDALRTLAVMVLLAAPLVFLMRPRTQSQSQGQARDQSGD
jgi:DHA2 family multidrug resistance protein